MRTYSVMFPVRFRPEDMNILKKAARKHRISKAEVIRRGITRILLEEKSR